MVSCVVYFSRSIRVSVWWFFATLCSVSALSSLSLAPFQQQVRLVGDCGSGGRGGRR